jgi:hypothetical protein
MITSCHTQCSSDNGFYEDGKRYPHWMRMIPSYSQCLLALHCGSFEDIAPSPTLLPLPLSDFDSGSHIDHHLPTSFISSPLPLLYFSASLSHFFSSLGIYHKPSVHLVSRCIIKLATILQLPASSPIKELLRTQSLGREVIMSAGGEYRYHYAFSLHSNMPISADEWGTNEVDAWGAGDANNWDAPPAVKGM